MALITAFVAGALFALLIAALPAWLLISREAADRIRWQGLLDAATTRVADLEAQIDSLHAKGLTVDRPQQPVVELPAEIPLGERVEEWLSGFDVDDQSDWRETARHFRQQNPSLDDEQLIAALESED